jgi:hypothetical protein
MSDTTITVIGMIVAFITALITSFLAEPIKTHFQNKSRINSIKIALYKEMFNNYAAIMPLYERVKTHDFTSFSAKHFNISLQSVCYDQLVSSDLVSLSQFRDYVHIARLYIFSEQLKAALTESEHAERYIGEVLVFCEQYISFLGSNAFYEHWDNKYLKQIMGKNNFAKMIEQWDSMMQEKVKYSEQYNSDNEDAQSA